MPAFPPAESAPPLALYIHWPFCEKICPYCDFNVAKWKAPDTEEWRAAYRSELAFVAQRTPRHRLISIYFGGGTPSLMPPGLVRDLIDLARAGWPHEDLEITLEANPNDCAPDRLDAFARAGVNRLSLGVQSLRENALKLLGRWHGAAEAVTAVKNAQAVFENVSVDLIYACPHQTIVDWRAELEETLALAPDHLSAYQLTIEPGTAFERAHGRGRLPMPDPDEAADFYMATQEICAAHGLPGYEISNHARPGRQSRHNLAYWRGQDYAGLGPGAHGRLTLGGQRFATETLHKPAEWLKAAGAGQGAMDFEPLTPEQQYTEYLLTGLRTVEGVSRQKAESLGLLLDPVRLRQLAADGFLEATPDTLRLTLQGRLVLDRAVAALLP